MNSLSVVIPTYNRLPRLRQVLAGLENQQPSAGDFEVIVVSDGATDGTSEYLSSAPTFLNLRHVAQENAGVAAARNRGIESASGDLILFLDDDVVPAPELIGEHRTMHDRLGRDAVVLGPMLTPPDFRLRPWVAWEQDMLNKQYAAMTLGEYAPTARQFFTGNTSLARCHLLDQGGFDTRFRRAEDVELAYRLERAGLAFAFDEHAIGHHYADRSFSSWLATPYAYGRNEVIFWRELGCDWLLPTIRREYHGRHTLIRRSTSFCLDRERTSAAFIHSMKLSASASHHAARFAYSAIFNLRYYQGVADELGGRDAFLDGVQGCAYESAPIESARVELA